MDSHTEDKDYVKAGGLFPIVEPLVGRVRRLVGTGGPNSQGQLVKMSKSLNNAIFLSDEPDVIRQKVMGMYTDPQRLRATDPGRVENNPLWIFHDTFNSDKQWIKEAKEKYQAGTIGDVECKKKLIDVLVNLLAPMQQRRQQFANDPAQILQCLREGAERINSIANDTLRTVKERLKQVY